MKRVNTSKGTGKLWQDRLHKIYDNFAEFEAYNDIYGIAKRLGYSNTKSAWRDNPMVQGSINPNDLSVVSK